MVNNFADGSTTEDLKFEWDPTQSRPVITSSDLFMGQFAIEETIWTTHMMKYSSGKLYTECKYGGSLGRTGPSCAKSRLVRP